MSGNPVQLAFGRVGKDIPHGAIRRPRRRCRNSCRNCPSQKFGNSGKATPSEGFSILLLPPPKTAERSRAWQTAKPFFFGRLGHGHWPARRFDEPRLKPRCGEDGTCIPRRENLFMECRQSAGSNRTSDWLRTLSVGASKGRLGEDGTGHPCDSAVGCWRHCMGVQFAAAALR